ncbi:hypothetical protein L614_002100000200 [Ochrobactrum sp. J50]|nr:hypothetical protein L614_002100000200 [Ochrobactrum sp. J50]
MRDRHGIADREMCLRLSRIHFFSLGQRLYLAERRCRVRRWRIGKRCRTGRLLRLNTCHDGFFPPNAISAQFNEGCRIDGFVLDYGIGTDIGDDWRIIRVLAPAPVEVGIGSVGGIGVDEASPDALRRCELVIYDRKCLRRGQGDTAHNRGHRCKGRHYRFQRTERGHHPASGHKARRRECRNAYQPPETEWKPDAAAARSRVAIHFCYTRHDTTRVENNFPCTALHVGPAKDEQDMARR